MSTTTLRRRRAPSHTKKGAPTRRETTIAYDAAPGTGCVIRSSSDVVAQLTHLTSAEQEYIWVLGLNAQHRVITSQCVALGTVDRVIVSGRDVFRELVRQNAACFILIHNHPSGAAKPSPQDETLTLKMQQGAHILGIALLDHVIIAREGHYSFAEQGLLEPPGRG